MPIVFLPDLFVAFVKSHVMPLMPKDHHFILIDGADGLGKSRLASALVLANPSWNRRLISIDRFKIDNLGYYYDAIHLDVLKREVGENPLEFGNVIVEGCLCLKVAEVLGLTPTFHIYVRGFNERHGQKVDERPELFLTDDQLREQYFDVPENERGLARELRDYHVAYRPETKAHLVVERDLRPHIPYNLSWID